VSDFLVNDKRQNSDDRVVGPVYEDIQASGGLKLLCGSRHRVWKSFRGSQLSKPVVCLDAVILMLHLLAASQQAFNEYWGNARAGLG